MPPDERRRLEELVGAADFCALPASLATAVPGADRFQYRLTVELGDRRQTVEVQEAASPRPCDRCWSG